MSSTSDQIHVAGRPVKRGSVGGLGFRVARALYSQWRRLSSTERARLEPLADDVRERALDLRGEADSDSAGRDLTHASQRLADALVDTAAANPEVSLGEVDQLRDDLARELDRLASADVAASRDPASHSTPDPPKAHRSG